MANSKYTTVTRTPSGSGRVRSTWELSDINTGLNIPANATIDKATVTVYFKETTNRMGNADIYVNFCDSNNNVVGDNLDYGDGVVPKNDPSTYGSRSTDIKNHIASGKISYSGASKFMVQFQSAFLSRNYSVYCIFSIDYTVHSHSYTSKVTKAATCTSAGETTYTCACGDSYVDKTKPAAKGHSWGDPTYTWSADGKTCTAKRVCSTDSSHTETASATVTSSVKTAATCIVKGTTRYTAKFSVSWATTQTKDVQDIPQKSHSYTGAIKSDGNGKDATHSFKCVNGCNQYGGAVKHTWNSGVVTQPTATSRGYTTYTCTASGCGATYTDNYTYIVTFKSDSGTTLKTETVAHGGKPTPPTAPTKADTAQWKYTFDGWYDANGNKWTSSTTITAATTFTARYTSTVQKYTIRWYNYDNTLLETDTDVPYGTKPTYNGADPTKTGDAEHSYQFAGWNYDTENGITPTLGTTYIDITAQFREIDNTYKVTWVNDGVVIEEDEAVPYGNKPDYNGATPTKASDAQYDYTFIGWSTSVTDPAKPESELETVKGDITYNAIYSATVKLYTIKVVLFDTESTDVVEYGRDFTIEAPDDVIGYKFVKWSDGVAVNPRTIKVTGEAIYQAVYERLPIPLKVNLDQATGVYIVPETEEIVIQFDGVSPALASTDLSVDGWNISVIDYPIDSEFSDYALYEYYPVTKLFISKNNKTTRIW